MKLNLYKLRNNGMNKTLQILTSLFILGFSELSAQQELNNINDEVYVNPGELVTVIGGVYSNGTGFFDNSGTITLTGDWQHDGTSTSCIAGRTLGRVEMIGAYQRIYGTGVPLFNTLSLQGSSYKELTGEASCDEFLELNDREFYLDGRFNVLNPSVFAITRNTALNLDDLTGFVSTPATTSRLFRAMNSTGEYIFPMGARTGIIYRPIGVIPSNNGVREIGVRFGNVDATTEFYDRSVKQPVICEINPLFYHYIQRKSGSTNPIDVNYYFDNSGNVETIKDFVANGEAGGNWTKVNTTITPGTGGALSYQTFSTNNFTKVGYALANPVTPQGSFTFTQVNSGQGVYEINLPISFVATPIAPNLTYTWDFGDGTTGTGQTIDHTFITEGTYTVKLTLSNGTTCETVYEEKVTLERLYYVYFPDAGTPNNDGINDLVNIYFSGYIEAHLYIFDRWGILIKELQTFDSPIVWDMKEKKGDFVPEDAYVMKLDLKRPDGKTDVKVSSLTVIR